MSKVILSEITTLGEKSTLRVSPGSKIDLTRTNSYLQLPKGSTEQRPESASSGELRYNTDTKLVEYYDGTQWQEIEYPEDYNDITKAGLVLHLDASSEESYPGVGNNWYDLASYGNNGQLFNTPTFDSTDLSFDFNTTDYVVFKNTPSLNITASLTVSCWFYPRNTAGYLYLKGRTDGDHYNPLFYVSGRYGWVGPDGRSFYAPQSQIITLNQWNNLTVTHISGQNPIIYLNGIKQTGFSYTEGSGTRRLGTNSWRANINSDVERGTTSGYDGKIAALHLYNRALTPGEVWKNYAALAPRFGIDPIPSIVTNGLVLNLDAANYQSYPRSGTTWTDLSGQSNNGTLVNSVGYSGSNGGSLSFDGTNGSIDIPVSSSLQAQNFTYDIWFKLNSLPVGGSPLFMSHYQANGTVSGLTVFEYQGQYWFQTRFNNSCCQNLLVGTASTNTWVNFSGTWDGSTKVAYLNGIQAGTQSVSGTHSQLNNFSIGNNADNIAAGNYNSAINGNISIVKYYNRALTASEIQQNFNAQRSRYGI